MYLTDLPSEMLSAIGAHLLVQKDFMSFRRTCRQAESATFDSFVSRYCKNMDISMESAHDWLKMSETEWLILLDNADKIDLNLGNYLPKTSHGNILVDSLVIRKVPRQKKFQVSSFQDVK